METDQHIEISTNDTIMSLFQRFRKKPVAEPGQTAGRITVEPDSVALMVATEGEKTVLRTVDRQSRRPVAVESRQFSGPEFSLLHAIEVINNSRNSSSKIQWMNGATPDNRSDDTSASLSDHPELIYMLANCSNVIDADGNPVIFPDSTASLILKLTPDADGKIFTPQLIVDDNDTCYNRFEMVSDSYVMVTEPVRSIIFGIMPTGVTDDDLKVFLTPVPAALLPVFLSMFLSNTTNIDISPEGYTVRRSRNPEHPQPTLLFEDVDSEKALYLRVTHSIADIPPEMSTDFNITRVADVSEHELTIRDVAQPTFDQAEAEKMVEEELTRVAPDRAALRNLYHSSNLFVIPAELAGEFLFRSLPRLMGTFRLLGTEKIQGYKIVAAKPKFNIKFATSSGIDFLEGDANIEIGEQKFTIADLLKQYTAKRYIQLADGSHAVVDEAYIQRLQRIYRKSKHKGKITVSFFDLPEIEQLLETPSADAPFVRYRQFYEGFNCLKTAPLPKIGIKGKLRPYQEEGLKWLTYLKHNDMGGCLADDMGLGKTIQTIALLSEIYPKCNRPSLIVMPQSLLFNWMDEFRKFAPKLKVDTFYGSTRSLENAMQNNVILTTYAIVRNDIRLLMKEDFEYVILDESQNIKNITAKLTQAVFLLKGAHRLAISGTPLENNLSELYSLFRFLNPAMFGSLDDFNTRYGNPIQRDNDRGAAESLRRRIFPFILRRLKKDVLTDLPERTDQTLYVDMEPEHARFYNQRRSYYRDLMENSAMPPAQRLAFLFQALTELRRIASVPESIATDNPAIHSSKIDMLTEQVENVIKNGHKTVVFFNFIAGIELTAARLRDAGVECSIITGSTSAADREKIVKHFQGSKTPLVLLMTVKTGGVGLNLTAADTVFIVEPWWNRAAEEQAINRLHRIGQHSKVHSYSMITLGTIEEKIRQLQQQKTDLFNDIIGSDQSIAKQLTDDDIRFILS